MEGNTLEADDLRRHCHVRGSLLVSAPFHFFKPEIASTHMKQLLHVCVETQLSEVIHTAAIEVTFVCLEEGECGSACNFGYPLFSFQTCNLNRLMHLAFFHAYSRLERVTREAETQLPVVAHAPSENLSISANSYVMRLPACDLRDIDSLKLWYPLGSQDLHLLSLIYFLDECLW